MRREIDVVKNSFNLIVGWIRVLSIFLLNAIDFILFMTSVRDYNSAQPSQDDKLAQPSLTLLCGAVK